MIVKDRLGLLAVSAVAVLAAGTVPVLPAAAAAPQAAAAAVAAKNCPSVGTPQSGATSVRATFHNQSVTVTATVHDHQRGETRLYAVAFAGDKQVGRVRSTSGVDDRDRNVTIKLDAPVHGGANRIVYGTESTYSGPSEVKDCYR
ncbi:hypothetical protein ACWD4G_26890 [Streptomyces sp. NPDC002643]